MCISISFANRSSLSKGGSASSSSLKGIFVKSVPGFCRILSSKATPGGAIRIPLVFSQKNLLFERSSIAGIPVAFSPGKNVTISLRPFRKSGKQTSLVYDGMLYASSLVLRSFSILSIVMYAGKVEAIRKLLSTCFFGVIRRNSAPQNVKPKPMKPRICEFE